MKNACFAPAWRLAMISLFVPLFCLHAAADSTFTFDVDFARFRMNDSTAVVEVYLAIPRHRLKFVEEGEMFSASFLCEISIFRGDAALIDHQWSAQNTAFRLDEIHPGQLLFTQAQFQVPVGEYRMAVRVEDENSREFGTKIITLAVPHFPARDLTISDLQFASLISKDSTASLYQKNNYKVVPNPAALYGTGMPIVYTYSEIYNLSFPSDSSYEVAYRVVDGNGREVKAPPAKRRHIVGASLVEVNALNIATLSSGTYTLETRVRDFHANREALKARKFFVYREQDLAADQREAGIADAMVEVYRRRSLAELDKEFETLRYIANEEEKKIFGSLTEEAKRDFLVRFWSRRDLTPETARNEFRDDYLSRVEYANKSFSGLGEGWKSDMGRVLLIYGYPSEVERIPSSGESRAYQEWNYYEIEGGVVFYFIDIKGWGNYELVHSTARAELQDPDWQRWLQVQ